MVNWFDGEVRFLAFDAGLVRAARALGFIIPRWLRLPLHPMAGGRDLLVVRILE
jgi:hypothetical protein